MAKFNNNEMKEYIAPDGYVYDYKNVEEQGGHLYVKYIYLTKKDSIDNYMLVEDPYGSKD